MHLLDDQTRRFGRLLHYLGVLAIVVGATAGYSFLHAPTVKAIEARAVRIQELTLSLQNAPVIREQHQVVSEKLHEVTSRIAEVQRRVPPEANAGEFLKEITRLASEQQLSIKDFNPEKPQSRNGYAEMEITLKGAGSFASICRFLDQLSKLNRLSKVKNLTLSAADGAHEYPMTATLVIYFGLQAQAADVVHASPVMTPGSKPHQEDRRG